MKKSKRKDGNVSPDGKNPSAFSCPEKRVMVSERTFFFFSFWKASLTLETAVVLPVFFLCMMLAVHYGKVCDTAVRLGSSMAQASEEIAMSAYVSVYGEGGSILTAGMTDAYAHMRAVHQAGDTSAIRNLSFIFSEFLENDEMIEVTAVYQVRAPFGIVRVPWYFFEQRACTRGWTGRTGSDGGNGSRGDTDDQGGKKVYVTRYGTVYHTDPNCTHIKLGIQPSTKEEAEKARNVYGEKYKPCEICGGSGGSVYITPDGNRYHSSLSCPGLKRTVQEMTLEEAGGLRPCSKCAGG